MKKVLLYVAALAMAGCFNDPAGSESDCGSYPEVDASCVNFLPIEAGKEHLMPTVDEWVHHDVDLVAGVKQSIVVQLGDSFVDVELDLDPLEDGSMVVSTARRNEVTHQFEIQLAGGDSSPELDAVAQIERLVVRCHYDWADLPEEERARITALSEVAHPTWKVIPVDPDNVNDLTSTLWWSPETPQSAGTFMVALTDLDEL